ncbi:aminotransferase class V-fold PLP-dependent enzyme [Celeribacter naphthalenivorans]|uniref:aminotransferase class V-fold PLP-dependent enzyme n=1 Tax=Celeribacter naphthalenivorans TaxID=1614694 RepID=UPI001CF9A1BE|nr:aminotransferase class V-fold PLP-dependent enzyme [Celeribacter naphthalenivorans]
MTQLAAQLSPQRALFDIPDEIAYFNAAYNAPLLVEAEVALHQGVRGKCYPWTRVPADFFEDAERFRTLAARAFGGVAENYALIPSASYGTSTVGRIFETRLGAEDEIVVIEEAFPSNFLPWQRLARETGARLVTAPWPEAEGDWTEQVLSKITPRTALVAVPNCHWSNGAVLDLIAISEATHAVGAALVVEVTQSLGAMPLDLARVQPDFMIASGYKWLLFPYGLSLFYAAPKWHDARPLEESWLNRAGAEVFEKLSDYAEAYQPGARRFDMGQKSMPTLLPGALVALRQIGDWGVENIAARLQAINDRLAEGLIEIGLTPVPKSQRSPHILGVAAGDDLPDGLIPALAERQVYVSRRGNALRIAPYLHVTEADEARLLGALSACLGRG